MADRSRDDVSALLDIVSLDVREAEAQLKFNDSPSNRRNYVRSIFAAIEGTTYLMKFDALAVMNADRSLGPGASSVLREENYGLDDQGNLIATPMFLRIDRNIRFTLPAYAHEFRDQLKLDYGGSGWAALKRAIKARNRSMHPRSASDLNVTDDDLRDVGLGYDWFIQAVHQTLLVVNQELKKQHKQLTDAGNAQTGD